jgi:uncharacterized membrane protein YkvA (DUF1232 family)
MKVSFELGESDLRYFRERLETVRKGKSARAENRIILGATKLLTDVEAAHPPDFVRERIGALSRLIRMLRDPDWRLEGEDRTRILDALAYFVDPDDVIPDRVPGIGYLDDAIMVEIVVRELTHELEAYDDFCAFRESRRTDEDVAEGLERRRTALQSRMRRRRHRMRSEARSREKPSRSRLGLLW